MRLQLHLLAIVLETSAINVHVQVNKVAEAPGCHAGDWN